MVAKLAAARKLLVSIRRINFSSCVIALMACFVMWHRESAKNFRIFQYDANDPIVLTITITSVLVLLLVTLSALRWALSFTVDPNHLYPALPSHYPNAPVAVAAAAAASNFPFFNSAHPTSLVVFTS